MEIRIRIFPLEKNGILCKAGYSKRNRAHFFAFGYRLGIFTCAIAVAFVEQFAEFNEIQ